MIVLIENGANMIMKVYQVNNELYSEVMSLSLKVKFDNLSKNIKSLPFPVSGAPQRSSNKYCYSFNNNNGRCERGLNCKYPHVCEKCGRAHFKVLKMAAMASNWLKNWKSLKIFFRTIGWNETKLSQNAGTAHP